jgi:hypothetical protein
MIGLHELCPAKYWPIHESMFISIENSEITRQSLRSSERFRGKFIQVSWEGRHTIFQIAHLLCPGNLGTVFNFRKVIMEAQANQEAPHIYFCCGDINPINMSQTTTVCSFLLGSYLILFDNASYEEVVAAFEPVSQWFLNFPDYLCSDEHDHDLITVFDCWRALAIAKLKGWIDFQSEEVDVEKCIDMMEYEHYDNALNGTIHVIIPSKLIAFRRPSEFSSVQGNDMQWQDVEGERHFGPSFYADIMSSEFGVQILVRVDTWTPDPEKTLPCDVDEGGANSESNGNAAFDCELNIGGHDEADPEEKDNTVPSHRIHRRVSYEEVAGAVVGGYKESAFHTYGIEVERLTAAARCRCRRRHPAHHAEPLGSMLRDLDRFLTLESLAPGALAIHGDRRGGCGGGDWLGVGGEALVVALLMRRHGFDACAALAWVRLAHPASPPPPLAFE